MKLIKEKEDGIVISRENRDQVLEHCFLGLVGKFLSSKSFNRRATRDTMRLVRKLGPNFG